MSEAYLFQAMLVQTLVAFETTSTDFVQSLRHAVSLHSIRPERRRILNFMVPVLCPHAVRRPQPRRPRQHALAELDSQRLAQKPQHPPGVFLNVPRIEDGRRAAGL